MASTKLNNIHTYKVKQTWLLEEKATLEEYYSECCCISHGHNALSVEPIDRALCNKLPSVEQKGLALWIFCLSVYITESHEAFHITLRFCGWLMHLPIYEVKSEDKGKPCQ